MLIPLLGCAVFGGGLVLWLVGEMVLRFQGHREESRWEREREEVVVDSSSTP